MLSQALIIMESIILTTSTKDPRRTELITIRDIIINYMESEDIE